MTKEKLYRLTNYKGKESKETDHNTIIVELNDVKQHQEADKKLRWNTKNKGWKLYKEITEDNKDLNQTWKSNDVQKEMKNWMKVVNNILRKSLGIIRISNKNKQGIDDEVREMLQEKRKIRKETNSTDNIENKNKLIRKRKEIEIKIKQKIGKNEEQKNHRNDQQAK